MFASRPRVWLTPSTSTLFSRAFATNPASSTSSTQQTKQYQGVYPILATAFHGPSKGEQLDLVSFERAVRTMKKCGAAGVTVAGVLGESGRLLDREREALIRVAVGAAEGMPVVVGTSHSGTYAVVELTKMAKELGASAVMVSPTNEASPLTDKAILDLYQAVGHVDIDIVLQDHPASTGVFMSLPLIANIANAVPQVKTIKLESPPTAGRIAQLLPNLPSHVSILGGLGGLYAGLELSAGSHGFMTGFAFPEVLCAIVKAHNEGNIEKRDRIYRRFLPLIVCEQQPGVALRKRLYQIRGIFDSAHVRHPAAQLSKELESVLMTTLASDAIGKRDLTQPIPLEDLE